MSRALPHHLIQLGCEQFTFNWLVEGTHGVEHHILYINLKKKQGNGYDSMVPKLGVTIFLEVTKILVFILV